MHSFASGAIYHLFSTFCVWWRYKLFMWLLDPCYTREPPVCCVFLINSQKCTCVCAVRWLRGHLCRSQIWKRVRWCCNSPWFASHCTESTVINSESGTSYILPLHSYLYLLSFTILSLPTLICSSLSPQRKIVFVCLSQSVLPLYILPNF